MKATFAVAAAAAVTGVNAASVHHRHAHDAFRALAKKDYATDNSTCGCTTIYSTYYGEATLSFPPAPPATSAPPPATITSTAVVVPTPIPQTCSTTGVYTFPATTVTLTDSTTVCVPSTTAVPPGTHTLGGVTTVVTTATTVTCPYATVSTSEGVVTSIIETTTYVCPSAGTYTIAPTTETAEKSTTLTVPVVTSYPPGTYTQPEVVTTVTETNTVIYCPFDIPTPTPTSVAITTPAVPATTIVPTVPATTPVVSVPANTLTPVPSVPSSTVAPSSSAPSTPKPSGGLGGTPGKPWGISYTPYKTGPEGGCKSRDDVFSDIKKIAGAGMTEVRVYSTDCDTLPNVGDACTEYGVRMIIGIYVDSPGCDARNPSVAEQISAIKSWGQWNMVDLITVGNEAVFHGYCQPSELASLVTKCRGEFAGYTGPYTTAETVNIWQQSDFSAAMCGVVDYAGCNAHAFFNTETEASQAGTFVKSQLDLVSKICNKPGVILETGWPSAGNAMGKAIPGEAQQQQAIDSIVKEVGGMSILFSLFNDLWKDGSTACGCEQFFGCDKVLGIL